MIHLQACINDGNHHFRGALAFLIGPEIDKPRTAFGFSIRRTLRFIVPLQPKQRIIWGNGGRGEGLAGMPDHLVLIEPVFFDIFKLARGSEILNHAFHGDEWIRIASRCCDLVAFDPILERDPPLLKHRLRKIGWIERIRSDFDDHLARS